MALMSICPLCGRVRRGDDLRSYWRRDTKSSIVENSQILLYPTASILLCFPLNSRYRTLFVGIRCYKVCIDDKSSSAHQSLSEASLHHRFEHMSQDLALPKPAVAALREAGVIRHLAVQSEVAEPAVGEVDGPLHTAAAPTESPLRIRQSASASSGSTDGRPMPL